MKRDAVRGKAARRVLFKRTAKGADMSEQAVQYPRLDTVDHGTLERATFALG
jgi:hypothetical protein